MTTQRTLITVPLDLLLTICESIYHNPHDNPGDPRIRQSHRHRLPAAIAELAGDWIAPDGIHSATASVDVVELHAETLIAVAAWCAAEGPHDVAAAAEEVREFYAACSAIGRRGGEALARAIAAIGPDDPADLNPEPMHAPQQDSVRNENGSHR